MTLSLLSIRAGIYGPYCGAYKRYEGWDPIKRSVALTLWPAACSSVCAAHWGPCAAG